MRIIDVNILLYVVNGDAPEHKTIRPWWDEALLGNDFIGLAWITLAGFIRIATNPKSFAKPLTAADALDRVDAWLTHPNVRIVYESDRHWKIMRGLLDTVGTAANLTTDAHLAALAITSNATIASCDGDFRRFTTVRWENPLMPS
jgi:hypothetical protein